MDSGGLWPRTLGDDDGFLRGRCWQCPEDFEKYRGSFDPTPQKEEVPLALQLAKKTKERSGVLAQIEHERGLVRDFETKFKKHAESSC